MRVILYAITMIWDGFSESDLFKNLATFQNESWIEDLHGVENLGEVPEAVKSLGDLVVNALSFAASSIIDSVEWTVNEPNPIDILF
jgi:hypothetical protein